MTKNFDNPLHCPLFGEDGDFNRMTNQIIGLDRGGRLAIKGGYTDRIFLSTDGSYWTTTALDQAIAALLHIRKEWQEELEARGIVGSGLEEPEELDEDDDIEEDEEPVEPAEGPEIHDDIVRLREGPGLGYLGVR